VSGDAARDASAAEVARWWPSDGADVTSASAAREWSRWVLVGLLPATRGEPLERDLELLVSELVTNAIRHGGGLVEVQLQLNASHIRLTVRDRNPDGPVVAHQAGEAELDAEHGRGLAIVESVSARWGVFRDEATAGKAVWLDLATC
jgi:anti-sigma regulatory factor (Ser/Thr protein kinase)